MRAPSLNLALSMTLVGLSVPASKVVVAYVPPLLTAELRFAMVALLLAPLALRGGRGSLPASARDWTSLSLLALFGMVLFNLFLLYGLRATSAVAAGIITSTIPAMTALSAALILRERVSGGSMAAIALAVLGMAALNLRPGGGGGPDDTLAGNALVVGAVVSEALYGVFTRRLGGRVPPLTLTFLANALAAVMMAPGALATSGGFDPALVPGWVWVLFVASGLASGLVAVVLWMRGIAHVPASRAGLFTGLIPAAGVLAAVLFLGEEFTLAHAAGLLCVLLGIVLGTGALRWPGFTGGRSGRGGRAGSRGR
ncbi:DMT family transporter [Azospirillum rugosum]|uniref:Drug/metabolite transporter (DMT)-like permease n=1 Tax=Azospirillum rugosum TaxID=416170 RepID=A0ABS4SSP6_9PROT|nr:DMT family transporter [Azospirillum rugosum]MBP2295264.1 drug/metabolite transporter (DMT)-like permease [Azospirillum rugosum]MDQ0528639.1 drug/metabolite transporter (DMT)-like permease [Azospirillum rugosum]